MIDARSKIASFRSPTNALRATHHSLGMETLSAGRTDSSCTDLQGETLERREYEQYDSTERMPHKFLKTRRQNQ